MVHCNAISFTGTIEAVEETDQGQVLTVFQNAFGKMPTRLKVFIPKQSISEVGTETLRKDDDILIFNASFYEKDSSLTVRVTRPSMLQRLAKGCDLGDLSAAEEFASGKE